MSEKRCYTCKHFEFECDAYFTIEHCKLYDKYPKNRECLKVCDDWTKGEFSGVNKVIAILKGKW